MSRAIVAALVLVAGVAVECLGQAPPPTTERGPGTIALPAWRAAGENPDRRGSPDATSGGSVVHASATTPVTPAPAAAPRAETAAPPGGSARRPVARVGKGNGTLPNEQGQVWREYDIGPYTARVTTTERPEQAIVDWILRETGYEAWHGEPLGVLSATRRTLRVYHTPEKQAIVADIVDRFVNSEAEATTFGLRVVTIDHPNWRARAQRLLRPVTVQTPGANAWLAEKEDAAVFLAELQRRNDYREHSSPHLLVNNAQATVLSAIRGRPYTRDVLLRSDTAAGYEGVLGQVDEGFSLELSPLLSLDRKMIDATIKCDIHQVEKLVPVILEVSTPTAARQRAKIEVPQTTQWRFHERFRWPIDQVLLISLGVVPMPVPVDGKAAVAGIPLPLGNSPARADLLVLIECKGAARDSARSPRTADRDPRTYRGRY